MKIATLRLMALVVGVLLIGGATPVQAQGTFAHGTVVALQGTPHLWFADDQGVLHWGGDTRALAGKHIAWSNRVEVSLDQLRTLPVGDPWLSAGLLKDGDPIYLVKWESNWEQPQLLHIQSIKDVELFGINGSNYGNFVIEKNEWERRFGISAAGLQRGVLASAVSAAPQPAAPISTAVPSIGDWELITRSDPINDRQMVWLRLRSTTYRGVGYDAALLFVICSYAGEREPFLNAQISWHVSLASEGEEGPVQVMYRFGSEEPVTENWRLGSSRRYTHHPSRNTSSFRGSQFLDRLQQHNRFAARVTTHDGKTLTATWDTTGLTAALPPVLQHCP